MFPLGGVQGAQGYVGNDTRIWPHEKIIWTHIRSIEPWQSWWPWLTFEDHFGDQLTAVTLCVQLTRDLLTIAKFFLYIFLYTQFQCIWCDVFVHRPWKWRRFLPWVIIHRDSDRLISITGSSSIRRAGWSSCATLHSNRNKISICLQILNLHIKLYCSLSYWLIY